MAELVGIDLEIIGHERLREVCEEIDKKVAELNALADEFNSALGSITIRERVSDTSRNDSGNEDILPRRIER